MEKKKVAFHSLGCKVNSYETDAMGQILAENGYEIVPFGPGADVYIINTCTVTNIADRKSRQMLHRAKKMNPDAIVVAAGCYAQVAADNAEKDDCVDIVVGNNRKQDIVRLIEEYRGETIVSRMDIGERGVPYEPLCISGTSGHTRAYIKIQDGCNQFCSYCLIPYARGRVRSRGIADIISEVEALVKNGYKEIVLTGIHISSYGTDFNRGKENSPLLDLLKRLDGIEGLCRVRLSSLEPRIMTEEFIRELSGLEKLCPHFHLSLQSGCEATLKRMNRRYTPKDYELSCRLIREYFSHPALTTDIIAGFPKETDNEFKESLEFVDSINFYETHIFKYSMRKGTAAAAMDGQVDEALKSERSGRLLRLNKNKMKLFMSYYIGKKVEILIEDEFEYEGSLYYTGYTKEYVRAAVPRQGNMLNRLAEGTVDSFLTEDVLLLKN